MNPKVILIQDIFMRSPHLPETWQHHYIHGQEFFFIGMTMVAKAVANSCILNQKVVNPYYRVDELYMPLYENKLHTTWCKECISFLTVFGVHELVQDFFPVFESNSVMQSKIGQ